jgi:NodT family efflux transporter outer membrane factor (OMF) lipoprotein
VFSLSACTFRDALQLPFQKYRAAPDFTKSGTAALKAKWWRAFDDDKLDAHIKAALQNNFSLAASWQRLKAAQAVKRRASSDLLPALDIAASGERQVEDGSDFARDNLSLGPEAAYELDLWGRIDAGVDAQRLRARASRADYRTAALTLSGDVALTWYRLIEAHNQLDLLKRQIATNEKVLKVLKTRFGAGQVRSQDILRQRLLIEELRENVLSQERRIQVLEHQLAVLRGQPPQGFKTEISRNMPALPEKPDAGTPAELIQRRPDVRRAYYHLKAADQELAAAIRDQFPRLTLSASYISEAQTAANLFSNWLATFGASMLAPVFDGFRHRAEIDRTQAVRHQRLNDYGQIVLTAFKDVEDALIKEQKQAERITNLEKRLSLAGDTYKQIRVGYFNGANDFIAMLEALNDKQQIARDLLSARQARIEARIALYRALAGGFATPREDNIQKDDPQDDETET